MQDQAHDRYHSVWDEDARDASHEVIGVESVHRYLDPHPLVLLEFPMVFVPFSCTLFLPVKSQRFLTDFFSGRTPVYCAVLAV